jgi:hypothetical protein
MFFVEKDDAFLSKTAAAGKQSWKHLLLVQNAAVLSKATFVLDKTLVFLSEAVAWVRQTAFF